MKRILSIVLVFTICVASGVFGASAALAPLFSGDVNADGNITVKDATEIQKYCAGMVGFNKLSEILADSDCDDRITIKDATAIQKYVAKIIKHNGVAVSPYINCKAIYSDYASGRAMAGVPVTFTADCSNSDERANPVVYRLFVNGVPQSEESETGVFTYTFDKAGEYSVRIRMHNEFGFSNEVSFGNDYKVVEPYESEVPVITSFYSHYIPYLGGNTYHTDDENVTFEAEVKFGNGDYKYAFFLDDVMIRDYSEDNTYTFESMPEEREKEYILKVRVKDSSTGDSYVYGEYPFFIMTYY